MSTAAAQRGARTFPLAGILVAIFAAAKVFGFSTMPWIWVFSPIWLALGFVVGVIVVAALLAGLVLLGAALLDARDKRNTNK